MAAGGFLPVPRSAVSVRSVPLQPRFFRAFLRCYGFLRGSIVVQFWFSRGSVVVLQGLSKILWVFTWFNCGFVFGSSRRF